jgi:Cft2 family RNA processing exonuclease
MRSTAFLALIPAALLAACGTALESPFAVFADPGKYEWHSCEQLLPQRKYWENKEKEWKLLMERARQGTGGAVISVVAYQSDYVAAREEIKLIDATARIKKCKLPDDWQSNSVIR